MTFDQNFFQCCHPLCGKRWTRKRTRSTFGKVFLLILISTFGKVKQILNCWSFELVNGAREANLISIIELSHYPKEGELDKLIFGIKLFKLSQGGGVG